ncbi:MAG: histidine kinase [Proteobacteria bacterium]|nr:histidine kinase [Pseudomonadota bacterium]
MSSPPPTPPIPPAPPRPPGAPTNWQRFSLGAVRLFHEYANWLIGISWRRFIALSVLLMIVSTILEKLPPFSWSVTELIDDDIPAVVVPKIPKAPVVHIEKPRPPSGDSDDNDDVSISIDKNGVRVTPHTRAASAAAAAASAASAAASAASAALDISDNGVVIKLPKGVIDSETLHDAVRQAKESVQEAIEEAKSAREDARAAREEAAEAAREAAREAVDAQRAARVRTRTVHAGDFLSDLAFLWIAASAILKITYKGRKEAEVKAAAAAETAESEQLKRQVVEARMAAMQAQVEPHFLFNTLASIDHLIETDPARASQMQKNLIALLRASMPTLRESQPKSHNLGREMAVIRPYLEILKVRMEDRLQTDIQVPDGLLSAEFPTMMIQSLVENAIKHGLEPKAEGGKLTVKAEIVHGKLAVTVADTGMGFGKAPTAGTGTGLNNIRERLQLLYGTKGSMTVSENTPSGTVVTLTVPYTAQTREGETA